jgi:protocatechuate 3,4-dioxygenase beta subunit
MNFITSKKRNLRINPVRPSIGIPILTIILFAFLAACSAQPATLSVSHAPLPPVATPQIPITGSGAACSSPAKLTIAQTEGPYFKAGSSENASLITPDMQGTKLVLSGYVLTTACKPVAHALLDFWQANANGQYDNSGYSLRGHQFSDAAGHYQLTTIVPGLYPGRTEHIHVKVQAPGGPVLTTQLYFPGVSQNQSDGIFDPSLVMNIQSNLDEDVAGFNFIITPQ